MIRFSPSRLIWRAVTTDLDESTCCRLSGVGHRPHTTVQCCAEGLKCAQLVVPDDVRPRLPRTHIQAAAAWHLVMLSLVSKINLPAKKLPLCPVLVRHQMGYPPSSAFLRFGSSPRTCVCFGLLKLRQCRKRPAGMQGGSLWSFRFGSGQGHGPEPEQLLQGFRLHRKGLTLGTVFRKKPGPRCLLLDI